MALWKLIDSGIINMIQKIKITNSIIGKDLFNIYFLANRLLLISPACQILNLALWLPRINQMTEFAQMANIKLIDLKAASLNQFLIYL